MTIFKSRKYQIYPTPKQIILLANTFGCKRFLWNKRVEKFNEYTKDVTHEKDLTIKEMKVEYPFLGDVPYNALDQADQDWRQTKSQFFSKTRKVKLGRPNYKKKGHKESFRLMKNYITVKNGEFYLSKLGKVKVRGTFHELKTSDICSCTVSKSSSGKYFLSVLVQVEIEHKPKTGKAIGIDLGIKDFAILSNGITIESQKHFRDNQAKLKKAQQHLSRKTKGSRRYNLQRIKVARIHEKISNKRNHDQHVLSKKIIDQYDIICIENLNVNGMIKNRKLSKSIQDAGWSTFVNKLIYKANWYGRTIQKIDRFYPSSKTCSSCGYKLEKLDLLVREWTCPECYTDHNRDLNAAINIRNEGLQILRMNNLLSSEEYSDYIRGEELSPNCGSIWHLR